MLGGLAGLALSACGSTAKPLAGSRTASGRVASGRGVYDDPRTRHYPCLKGLKVNLVPQGAATLLIGTGAQQAKIDFLPTPGAAQAAQISGQIQGAEVVGSALLYPQGMSDQQLKPIEDCLSQGVKG